MKLIIILAIYASYVGAQVVHSENTATAQISVTADCPEALLADLVNGTRPILSALNDAIRANATNEVQCIIKNFPALDLEQSDKFGNTPLLFAASLGLSNIASLLLKRQNNPSSITARNCRGSRYTALHYAAASGNVHLGELLLNSGVPIDARDVGDRTALHLAVMNNKSDFVRLLLDNKANVDAIDRRGRTALYVASYRGHVDIARVFIEHRADTSRQRAENGYTPLLVATQFNHPEIVKLLLDEGEAYVDAQTDKGMTALLIAAEIGIPELVGALLERNATVNMKDEYGRTILHIVSETDQSDVAEIAVGIDNIRTESKDNNGLTPLHVCAKQNAVRVGEILVEKGANLNALDKWNQTPLHYAAMGNSDNMLRLLLDSGADLVVKSLNGETPLHIAASRNLTAIAHYLLSYSSGTKLLSARSNEGKLALDLATSYSMRNLIKARSLLHTMMNPRICE